MSQNGQWKLAPAYDVTFCEGPGGYHQMDIMGEALDITRSAIVKLGIQEAELSIQEVDEMINSICEVASRLLFSVCQIPCSRLDLINSSKTFLARP